MCGLIGVVSTEKFIGSKNRARFLEQGLKVGLLRGEDATGMFWVDNEGAVDSYKKALNGFDFLYNPLPNRLLDNIGNFPIVIGHHRFKTQGDRTHKEAHPFTVDHITLVHNGGVNNSHQLPGYERVVDEPNVDSYRLTYAIAKKGAKAVLETVEGAYSLIWWDDKEKALFFVRNDKRPLALAIADDKASCYFASECGMLQWLLDRNQIKVKNTFQIPAPLTIWKVEMGKNKVALKKVETFVKKALPPVVRPPVTTQTTIGGGNRPPAWNNYSSAVPTLNTGVKRPSSRLKWKSHGTQKVENTKNCPTLYGQQKGKIVHNLNKFGIKYGESVWAIPAGFEPHTRAQHKGMGLFTTATNPEEFIYVYDMLHIDWKDMCDGVLAVCIDVTNAHQHHLVGKINWPGTIASGVFVQKLENENDDHVQFIPGPDGKLLTAKTFNIMTKDGCCFCGGNVMVLDAEDIEWQDNKPLCETCIHALDSDDEKSIPVISFKGHNRAH